MHFVAGESPGMFGFRKLQLIKKENINYDRWNSSQTIIDLQNEGMECNPFGQGYGSMGAPTKEFEKLVLTEVSAEVIRGDFSQKI